jgi:hypothetical protein
MKPEDNRERLAQANAQTYHCICTPGSDFRFDGSGIDLALNVIRGV